MSFKKREKAKKIIAKGIALGRLHLADDISVANYILNQLMKEGFASDQILITAEELQKELNDSVPERIISDLIDIIPNDGIPEDQAILTNGKDGVKIINLGKKDV